MHARADLGFIVTDDQTYFSEEKRDARSETSQMALGVPAYRIRNTAVDGRYRIEKEVLTDPWQGDDDLGGYHLTWPRDLVTQEPDGRRR